MERNKEVLVGETELKYERKWIVFSHVRNRNDYRLVGVVEAIFDTWEEAYDFRDTLGDAKGKTLVGEGFDPRPQIGGLYVG
ncbi:MAG: hypothetical protein LBS21_02035 [Clostridiales bacterium]|jgi:hypothetical protein|nr:hypothetical protein [Clostridiales bacterium]